MMGRFVLLAMVVLMGVDVSHAQSWDRPYHRDSYYRPSPEPFNFWGWGDRDRWGWYEDDRDFFASRRQRQGPEFRSGGPRPAIAPITPPTISFPSAYEPGSIVIDTGGRQLFLVQSPTTALYYPIGVGRIGFSWTGTEKISRKAIWPDWYPPAEMRAREQHLPRKMSGGIRNPLGATALYLGDTLYRIHGTNDAKSVGRATSSGCFRMLNGHIVDLASRVSIGAPVIVVRRLPPELAGLVAEQVGSSPQRASQRIGQPS